MRASLRPRTANNLQLRRQRGGRAPGAVSPGRGQEVALQEVVGDGHGDEEEDEVGHDDGVDDHGREAGHEAAHGGVEGLGQFLQATREAWFSVVVVVVVVVFVVYLCWC